METVGMERPVEAGVEYDRFNDDYSYSLYMTPYILPGEDALLRTVIPVDLYRVELVVNWGDDRRPREARFVTLRSVAGERL